MTFNPNPPKFEKRDHHIVPKAWQRRFFPVDVGSGIRETKGFYKDLSTGRVFGPEGPGMKMSEKYANTVYDHHFRPSDQLEDRISEIEGIAIPALDRITQSRRIKLKERGEISILLALQSLRDPTRFGPRLDIARLFAVALGDVQKFPNAHAFNTWLSDNNLAGGELSEANFQKLKSSGGDHRTKAIDYILAAQIYDPNMNANEIINAVPIVASHISALGWDLIEAQTPQFILSDVPMPLSNLGYEFSVPLTDTLALKTSYPSVPVDNTTIIFARPANAQEVAAINRATCSRAVRYLCGPQAVLAQV